VNKPMEFIPDIAFFKSQLQKANVSRYETSRNHLQGSVTYLSPFITHGFESLPNIVSYLKKEKGLTNRHKLFAEFGWREYYSHVWTHLGGRFFKIFDLQLPMFNTLMNSLSTF
jgi:deoxyribodipyrimidine photo-lyase